MRISDWSSDVCSSDLRIRNRAGNIGDALSVGDGEYGFKSLLRHVCHAATKPIGSRAVGANDAQVAAKLNKHHVHTGEENVDVSAQPFFALILSAEPGRQFTILIKQIGIASGRERVCPDV